MTQLSDGSLIGSDRRQADFLHMARILGQAVKFSARVAILSGDAPLERDTLIRHYIVGWHRLETL